MLKQQEPYPAVVVDRRWNLLQSNKGAVAMMEFLVGPLAPGAAINLADALVAPDMLRPYLTNWQEVIAYFVRSVEADAAADATEETATLRDRLLSYPGVQESLATPSGETVTAPILPMRFAKGQVSLELFTTLTTLGMPQDANLQEMRIESFFPMNEETRQVFRLWTPSDASASAKTDRDGPGGARYDVDEVHSGEFMPVTIEVYYDFRSPYAYFADHRIRERSFAPPVPVNWLWRPVSIDVLLKISRRDRYVAPYSDPLSGPKRAHLLADVHRNVAFYNAPLLPPKPSRPIPFRPSVRLPCWDRKPMTTSERRCSTPCGGSKEIFRTVPFWQNA